jgi:hypothetical protein
VYNFSSFACLGGTIFAPAIVRSGLRMAVKNESPPGFDATGQSYNLIKMRSQQFLSFRCENFFQVTDFFKMLRFPKHGR